MEKIIIGVLLALVVLLLYLLVKTGNNPNLNHNQRDSSKEVPDILGRPKPGVSPTVPIQAVEINDSNSQSVSPNFDTENRRDTKIPIPQEEPDEEKVPDWDVEEQEMKRYAARVVNSIDNGLATGVTYEELATIGKMLQLETLEASEKKRTVRVVSKIDGTELMQMLDTVVGDASKRIASLLDQTDDYESDSGSSNLRKNDFNGFDIGEFT